MINNNSYEFVSLYKVKEDGLYNEQFVFNKENGEKTNVSENKLFSNELFVECYNKWIKNNT